MNRAGLIRHPGPPSATRRHVVPGHARRVEIALPAGALLMDAVAAAMDDLGCDSAWLVLDGLRIGPYSYVMPWAESPDGERVAWYSETHSGAAATLEHAVASVGRKDGPWFLHCHAVWDSETDAQKAGHLLPDRVTLAEDATVQVFAFEGGVYDWLPDAETKFSFFLPRPAAAPEQPVNAAIVTLAPFEDLAEAAPALAAALGLGDARLYGLGSLIGADFETGPAMESPVSEVLLLPGARPGHLPAHCVDPEGGMFRGALRPGTVPVLITFDLLLTAPDV